MQLTILLLYITAVLAILSGLAVLIGSRKSERLKAASFLMTAIGAGGWAIGIATFASLPPGQDEVAKWVVLIGIYIAPLIMDMGLTYFVAWEKGWLGKILTGLIWIGGIVFAILVLTLPDQLYKNIVLSNRGNDVTLVQGWLYMAYALFIMVATTLMTGMLLYNVYKGKTKRVRTGNLVFFVCLSITGILSLIFDIIMPGLGNYDTIWPGPLAISLTVIGFYYAILRYKLLNLAANWMKILSYIILIATAAAVYMVIFYIIFTALFKIPNPSTSIFVLNFIMIVIVLLLMPVVNEMRAFTNSLINTGQVDLAYIVKRLNKMANKVDYNELADFLADHLHFSYIGFLIDRRIYGSGPLALSTGEIREVSRLKKPEKGIWQQFNEPVSEAFHRLDINAVAQLEDAKGKAFGQILVGKPQGKMSFEHRDLIQLEMIINLVAALIDTKAK